MNGDINDKGQSCEEMWKECSVQKEWQEQSPGSGKWCGRLTELNVTLDFESIMDKKPAGGDGLERGRGQFSRVWTPCRMFAFYSVIENHWGFSAESWPGGMHNFKRSLLCRE